MSPHRLLQGRAPLAALRLLACAWTMVCVHFASPVFAQVALDEAPDALPVTTLYATATHQRRNTTTSKNAHAVRDRRVISDRQVVVSNCDLLVDGDGHLRLERCWLRVQGDVFLKDRGVLELVDCRVQVENSFPRQFNYWFEGGELRTTRCLIGGVSDAAGNAQITTFQLHRGHWQLVDTTIQYSGGILLGEGRSGQSRDPFLRGGSLHADGIHQGAVADAIVPSGYADVILRNSTFNLRLALYADGKTPSRNTIDFITNRTIASVVYGDAALVDSMPLTRKRVTHDIKELPYRLEIENSVVPFWFVGIYGISSSGAATTFVFQDAQGLNVGLHAKDLRGRPLAIGPWSQYTNDIPQLPAVQPSGHHEMPPGCGVRIGNVDIVAPATRATRISGWSLYLEGTATDFSIEGPTHLAEIVMLEGKLAISGREAYDARIAANTIELHRDAVLALSNVSIGRFDLNVAAQPYMQLEGRASCTIDTALIEGLRVRSSAERFCCREQGVNATTFLIRNFIERDRPLDAVATGQSVFTVQRATATQDFDLTNANMDSAAVGGQAASWKSSGVGAQQSSDKRPWSSSVACNELTTTANTATMSKTLRVAAGSFVAVRAWIKPITVPSGAGLRLRITGTASGTTFVDVPLDGSEWRQSIATPHRVSPQDTSIEVALVFTGASLRVRVDDVEIRPTSWADIDTVTNADFDEASVLGFGFPPLQLRHPAFWSVWNGNASYESSLVRPGARAGSKALRFSVTAGEGQISKLFRDLAEGTLVRVTGWMRVVASQRQALKVHIGDERQWWDTSFGNNQLFYVYDAAAWTQFTVDYRVPIGSRATRIAVTGASPGADILIDDLQVTFSR